MISFTALNNPEIDLDIQKDLDRITDIISSCVKLDSIYLAGSFGRGEGTVIFKDNKWVALNDYDIIVISNEVGKQALLKMKLDSLAKELKLDFIDIRMIPRRKLPQLPCTLENYDIRYASRLLIGEEVLHEMPCFRQSEIPVYEMIRLICNRCAGAASIGLAGQKSNEYASTQIRKAFIAVGDCILYLSGEYHCSYAKRLDKFMGSDAVNKLNIIPACKKCSDSFAQSKPTAANEPVKVNACQYKLTSKERNMIESAYYLKLYGCDKAKKRELNPKCLKGLVKKVFLLLVSKDLSKAYRGFYMAELALLKKYSVNYAKVSIYKKAFDFFCDKGNVNKRILFSQPYFYCEGSNNSIKCIIQLLVRFLPLSYEIFKLKSSYSSYLWFRAYH